MRIGNRRRRLRDCWSPVLFSLAVFSFVSAACAEDQIESAPKAWPTVDFGWAGFPEVELDLKTRFLPTEERVFFIAEFRPGSTLSTLLKPTRMARDQCHFTLSLEDAHGFTMGQSQAIGLHEMTPITPELGKVSHYRFEGNFEMSHAEYEAATELMVRSNLPSFKK